MGETKTPTLTPTASLSPTPPASFYVSRNVYWPERDVPPVYIQVHLALPGPYTLKVYNSAGELVRTLRNEWVAAVRDDKVEWNARNEADEPVSSGVYVIYFISRYETRTAKLLILR